MKYLDAVFRDATDPILIEDLNGQVIDLNDEAVRMYGYTKEELIERPIKMILPPERHTQADELLQRCRTGEVVRSVEGVRVAKNGEQIPVLLSLSLLTADSGEPTAIATFAKDISSLKLAEADIAAANERLTHELAVAQELSSAADREIKFWLQGESIAARALREIVTTLAGVDDPVLMTGPMGSCQEQVARAIHRESARKMRPFIYVACHHATGAEETIFGLD